MSWIDGLRERLRWLARGASAEKQLEDELRFHLELETERQLAAGLSPEAARRAAARALGDLGRTQEEVRDERGISLLEDTGRDLAYAVRGLARRPGFTLAVLLTLGLGVGANTAVFSIVHGVLLRPLDYPQADQLVVVWPNQFLSVRETRFIREQARTFVAATYAPWTLALTEVEEPTHVPGAKTSANLFRMLGVSAVLGRAFVAADDVPGAAPVAVISHRLWNSRFGADPSVIGRAIRLDGGLHTIVGVMPESFEILGRAAEVWVPLIADPGAWYFRSGVSMVFARLATGATVASANAEFAQLTQRMRAELELPATYGEGATILDLKSFLTRDYRTLLLVLLGAVGGILLLAGANLANLLLARAVGRQAEMGMRAALGAKQSRLIRQVLTEGIALSALGGGAGLALAFLVVALLQGLVPQGTPRISQVTVDGTVLLVCGGLALAMAVIFGMTQAVGMGRLDPARSLGSRTAALAGTRVTERVGGVLIVSQVAMSVALVIGAVLMIRTLERLATVQPGFDHHNVLTLSLQPTGARYRDPNEVRAFYAAVFDRLAAIPGVVSAGAVQHLPLSGFEWGANLEIEDQPLAQGQPKPRVGFRIATPGYFETMRIPLIEGRTFTDADRSGEPGVAVVNQAMAQRFWAGGSAIGKRFRQGENADWVTVIGVVGDVKHRSLVAEAGPELYQPAGQSGVTAYMVAVRTSVPPMSLARRLQATIWAIDPDVAVSRVTELRSLVRESVGDRRLLAVVLGGFAALALLVGTIGVFGVTNFTVRRRTREIAIRMAMGATGSDVRTAVLRRGMTLVLLGVAIGLGTALGLTRFLQRFVYGVGTTDAVIFAGVAVLLCVVAAAAIHAPAARATRVDPVTVLRDS